MWYFEFVSRILDGLHVSEGGSDYGRYVPHWLGVAFVYGQVFGMGLLGLLCALWALFKLRFGGAGLLFLFFFTVLLPFPYGFLTGWFINFASKCGGGIAYVWMGPLCALPGSMAAWHIFLVVWAIVGIRQYRNKKRSLPPAS